MYGKVVLGRKLEKEEALLLLSLGAVEGRDFWLAHGSYEGSSGMEVSVAWPLPSGYCANRIQSGKSTAHLLEEKQL